MPTSHQNAKRREDAGMGYRNGPRSTGFAAANSFDGKSDDDIRAAMGDKFPKRICHSIICIGALIAHHDGDHWVVDALGAPDVGERFKKEWIASFVDRIAELTPQLVTFNGSSFHLPVDTAQWNIVLRRLGYRRDRTSIVTLTMQP